MLIDSQFYFLFFSPSMSINNNRYLVCCRDQRFFFLTQKYDFIFLPFAFWIFERRLFLPGGRCWIVKVTRLSGVTRSQAKHGNTLVVFYFHSEKQNKTKNNNTQILLLPFFRLNSTNVTKKRGEKKTEKGKYRKWIKTFIQM